MFADREGLERTVRRLGGISRPSASPGEREAAEWIAAQLRELGLEAAVEEERAHGTYWIPIGVMSALGLAGALVRPRWLGRALAAAATVALVDDLEHRSRWFRRAFLPRRPTYNVVAEAGDAGAQRTVVVVAHHAAAHVGGPPPPRRRARRGDLRRQPDGRAQAPAAAPLRPDRPLAATHVRRR